MRPVARRLSWSLLGLATAACSCSRSVVDLSGPAYDFVGDGRDGDAQALTGETVVNVCRPLLDAAGAQLDADGSGFAAGDVVLVMQVQDDYGAVAGDSDPVTAPGRAGQWELARVESASASALLLEKRLTGAYETVPGSATAQVCRVPQYQNVTVAAGARLSATSWNGSTGGVLAFLVSGTLTVAAAGELSASGRGFRGGTSVVVPAITPCGEAALTLQGTSQRGEGLDATLLGTAGRGNAGIGGGAGNPVDAGGGGGAGGGAGGFGGTELSTCAPPATATRGFGGAPLLTSVSSRLAFGGGGGAGFADFDEEPGYGTGGAGGGIVLVNASTLAGAGTIVADGAMGTVGLGAGGGGGGGGGTVRVLAGPDSSFSGTIRARGGNGADTLHPAYSHGPGGGGGGGRIHVAAAVLSSGATLDAGAGAPGNDEFTNTPWDATAGEDGTIEIGD